MANAWFRMYSEFAHDPKVQMLDEVTQRRYIMLLCLQCSNVTVTLHDDEVAFQLRITFDDYIKTKQLLRDRGLVDENNKPTAWDKRQYVSDSSAARVAKHREHKKRYSDVTVTKCNALEADTDTEADTYLVNGELTKKPAKLFKPPTLEEAFEECGNQKEAKNFIDYYTSNGWRVGKNKMKDWKASLRGWIRRADDYNKSFAKKEEIDWNNLNF